jgi:hypothetical protein
VVRAGSLLISLASGQLIKNARTQLRRVTDGSIVQDVKDLVNGLQPQLWTENGKLRQFLEASWQVFFNSSTCFSKYKTF